MKKHRKKSAAPKKPPATEPITDYQSPDKGVYDVSDDDPRIGHPLFLLDHMVLTLIEQDKHLAERLSPERMESAITVMISHLVDGEQIIAKLLWQLRNKKYDALQD